MRKIIFTFLFVCFKGVSVAQCPVFSSKQLEKNKFKLFCGNSNPALAQEVAYILGVNLSKANVVRFNDGEVNIRIEESIRG